MTKVSVLIGTYNRANLVVTAIKSALQQPLHDLEVVVVDDGSGDSTREAINNLGDARIRYIYQENRGFPYALNRGFQVSTGEYIGIIGDDDGYVHDGLAPLVELLDRSPEIGLAAGGYNLVDESGQMVGESKPWQSFPHLDLPTLLTTMPFLEQSMLVRRQWVEKIAGFDEKLVGGSEDWDFFIRLALAGCRMAWVKSVVSNYCVRTLSSYIQSSRLEESVLYILEKAFNSPAMPENILLRRSHVYHTAYLNMAEHLYSLRQYELGGKYLERVIQLDPGLTERGGQRLAALIAQWSFGWRAANSPQDYRANLIDHLPAAAANIPSFRQKVAAEAAVIRLYRAYGQRDKKAVQSAGLDILRNDPRRILDRGVLSVLSRSII